jgi:enoyl-CoA hydratase/carnithine racemase
VPHDALPDALEECFAAARRTGPKSRTVVKDEMNRHLPAADINRFRRSPLSPEMVEGMKAFLEKREPDWPWD